jgi:hypothetical protein
MAQIISATIYGANSNDWNQPSGVAMAFPVQQIVLRTIPPTSYSGVTCVTQIQLLPTAPSPIQPVYYTNTAIGSLVASGNA